ncbi:tRNA pseudouridine(55) synthase TruB [Coxiella endosymbiont of Amblyomma nuttalli]|uniref:tRNA pseudouridine(55) synthase TruB n=1 Tax=Coxiella endosymbiont of Amblyomma nuttalli TaxID=2749996 RepID=UPI001BA54E7D|nr:tRNA pseudouridine(55) synthase TruB [Coxiella endosymbiont of Amblyomma nuttalli]
MNVTNSQKIHKRAISGILLLNKLSGMTSNNAVQRIKKLFHAKKVGHTGSLDPLAEGMLPICLGEATKFSQYLLDSNKTYYVKVRLGIRTASGDSEGKIIAERPIPKITKHLLEKTLSLFRGVIEQTPSMYSALKYKGQPLYKLARQGIKVERKARRVTIDALNVLNWNDEEIEFYVHCSKGTYIRTLMDDIGETLNCGAHVVALRRLMVMHYRESQMIPLVQLEQEYDASNLTALDLYLLPVESMILHFPALKLNQLTTLYLQQGRIVMISHALSSGFVRLRNYNDQFIGIGEILSDARIAPRRLIKQL